MSGWATPLGGRRGPCSPVEDQAPRRPSRLLDLHLGAAHPTAGGLTDQLGLKGVAVCNRAGSADRPAGHTLVRGARREVLESNGTRLPGEAAASNASEPPSGFLGAVTGSFRWKPQQTTNICELITSYGINACDLLCRGTIAHGCRLHRVGRRPARRRRPIVFATTASSPVAGIDGAATEAGMPTGPAAQGRGDGRRRRTAIVVVPSGPGAGSRRPLESRRRRAPREGFEME
jgi:hypothetical protein